MGATGCPENAQVMIKRPLTTSYKIYSFICDSFNDDVSISNYTEGVTS
jgi:hypothetical protein